MKKKVLKELLSTGLYLLFVLLLTWLLITFVIQRTEVDGSSMEATLSHGDNLFVDKISYRFHDPERFDIIVFPFQYQEDTYYIKRIIGMPGEIVWIDASGKIHISDTMDDIYSEESILEESYGLEMIKPEHIGRAAEPVTLGEDEYFVMGDNRNNSKDSRTDSVGNIHRDDIIGRAWVRIWPFEKMCVLEHR